MILTALLLYMKDNGDIPDKDEVRPENVDDSLVDPEAQYKVQLVSEIMSNGGIAHIYFGHTQGEGNDIHLHTFNTHLFPDLGLIYWHAEDEDHWGYGGDIEMVERHYED